MKRSDKAQKEERDIELYSQLCNWFWLETHPNEPLVTVRHTSDESRAFASTMFEVMNIYLAEDRKVG